MKNKIVLGCVSVVMLVAITGILIFIYNQYFYPVKYENEIIEASREFGVDSYLIASVINAESRFDQNAVSSKGAVGLMQVLPTTAVWVVKKISNLNASDSYDVKFLSNLYDPKTKSGELFDPKTNIRIGTYYLSYLINKFKDLKVSLCAYNAGEGIVKEWLNNSKYSVDGKHIDFIPYEETKNYINKIERNMKFYKNKF